MKKVTLVAVLLIMPLSFASLVACAGFTWDDVPVYPGATQVNNHEWFTEDVKDAFKEHWDRVEWRYYVVDNPDISVDTYYMNEMPERGWSRIIASGSQPYVFSKNNDNHFAAVYAFPGTGGSVEIVLVRAAGPK